MAETLKLGTKMRTVEVEKKGRYIKISYCHPSRPGDNTFASGSRRFVNTTHLGDWLSQQQEDGGLPMLITAIREV